MKELYGLIGEKLGHSYSPFIHHSIMRKTNIVGEYKLFPIEKQYVKSTIYNLAQDNIKGLNVTIPYKVDIIPYLHGISKEAKNIGAINTIDLKDNTLIGYNTDYYGFGKMLKNFHVDVKNRKAVILGTGGASRAVVQYLLDEGVRDIVYITRKPIEDKTFKYIGYNEIGSLKNQDMIINCTPCGMYPNINNCAIAKKDLKEFSVAIDLIYNPEESVFLRFSKEMGMESINGLYMLVAQAVKSQEIWQNKIIKDTVIEGVYKEMKELLYGKL